MGQAPTQPSWLKPHSHLSPPGAPGSAEREGYSQGVPGKLRERGESRGAHVQQASSLEPRREAAHVGVGDSEGGGAAGIAWDAGSRSSAPPPALAPPSLAALKPAPGARAAGSVVRSVRSDSAVVRSVVPQPFGTHAVLSVRPPLPPRVHVWPPHSSGSPRLARSPRRRPSAPGLRG